MIITTNGVQPAARVEPRKLNRITTGIIPDVEPRPSPKGDGFAKIITTHDEPGGKVAAPESPVGSVLGAGDIEVLGQSLKKGFESIEQLKKEAASLGVILDEPKAKKPGRLKGEQT